MVYGSSMPHESGKPYRKFAPSELSSIMATSQEWVEELTLWKELVELDILDVKEITDRVGRLVARNASTIAATRRLLEEPA
jgi:hypothetical protein